MGGDSGQGNFSSLDFGPQLERMLVWLRKMEVEGITANGVMKLELDWGRFGSQQVG